MVLIKGGVAKLDLDIFATETALKCKKPTVKTKFPILE